MTNLVKYQQKEDKTMPTFRVQKTCDYTIMSNAHFRDTRLSLKAKGLLSFMLSLPEDWDYTQKGLARTCKDGVDSIAAALSELERAGYLTRIRKRDSHGRVRDTIYNVYEIPHEVPDEDYSDTRENSSGTYAEAKNKGSDLECQIHRSESCNHPLNPANSPKRENPVQVKTESKNKPKRDFPRQENPVQVYKDKTITNITNKDCDIVSNHMIASGDTIRDDDIERYRDLVCENIDYDSLKERRDINCEMLAEILEIIVQTLCECSQHKHIRVSKTNYPSNTVRQRLLELDQMHIEYVLYCLEDNKTTVKSPDKYILAALFKAPTTINSFYTMRVHHDMVNAPKTAPPDTFDTEDFFALAVARANNKKSNAGGERP